MFFPKLNIHFRISFPVVSFRQKGCPGNVNEMLEVPAMKKVIGWPESIAHLSGGAAESLRKDGSMFVEMQAIIASTAEIGFNRVGCEWI